MKLMKRILIVIAVILLIVGIWILRNVMIFKKLESNLKPYEEATNYYIKMYMRDSNQVYETYRKENRYATKIRILPSNGVKERKLMCYGNGETFNTYINADEKKVAQLNSVGVSIPSPATVVNVFEGMTALEYLKMATFSTIATEDWNGKDCYKIMLRYSPNVMYMTEPDGTINPENFYGYFEKETGLMLKFGMNEYEYRFNSVTDNDLKEPNVENYEVMEN